MSESEATREEMLRENDAESKLALLRSRVEQHITSVGRTSPRMIERSGKALDRIEVLLAEMAQACDDPHLANLISEATSEFAHVKARQVWHDQQIEAYAPIRNALYDLAGVEVPNGNGNGH